ncbi:MAG: N-acetylglucosamine-6-phosphate deacetylase [Kosmotogaceae bacterium]
MKFENILIVDPVEGEFTGTVSINENYIIDVERNEEASDYEYILMPGFVDPHTHGSVGVDTLSMDQKGLQKWESFLYSKGVTFFLPTTMSAPPSALLSSAKVVQKYLKRNPLSSVGGIHYEGPYISVKRKGAQKKELIRDVDLEELKSILVEPVKMVTMAPELENFFDAYKLIRSRGIKGSIGHTDASFEIMKKAFEEGCTKITHFPNGMNTLHHRNLGCVGAVFSMPFSIEMIIDGVHSLPDFINMVYKIKGAEKIMIVSDTISATGMPDGDYELGGQKIYLRNSRPVLEDGTIAATTLVFSEAVKNFKNFTNCSLKELAFVSSYNSLKSLGINNRGRISEGYIADLVLLDRNLEVKETIIKGKAVYKS